MNKICAFGLRRRLLARQTSRPYVIVSACITQYADAGPINSPLFARIMSSRLAAAVSGV
jgi:hypothetical protein